MEGNPAAAMLEVHGRRAVTSPLEEGQRLAGKFEVGRVIGVGGAGVVHEGRQMHLDRRVAIKVLRQPPTIRATQRILREARVAAQIDSPHVARVIDVGQLDTGAPYVVMELLEGRSLARILRERGALEVSEAVRYALEACEGLAEVHARGAVHRDVKPSNLFLAQRPDGEPVLKLIDFGLVTELASSGGASDAETLTGTAEVMGTPRYMAPEQMRSAADVDQRVDVWALGAVLYEALTGRPPFEASTFAELVLRVDRDPPATPRALRPEIPEALEVVILHCLERDRERRFASVAELGAALASFAAESGPARARRVAAILAVGSGEEEAPSQEAERGAEEAGRASEDPVLRRAPSKVRAGILLGAAILAAIGAFVVRRFEPDGQAALPMAGAASARASAAAAPTAAPSLPPQLPAELSVSQPGAEERPARELRAERSPPAGAPRPTQPAPSARVTPPTIGKRLEALAGSNGQ